MQALAADHHTKIRLADLCSDGTHCCYAYGNIVMLYVLKPPSEAFLDRFHAALARIARRYARGIGMLVWIDSTTPVPSNSERAWIKQALLGTHEVMRACVQLVEGEGLAAPAKRSTLTLLNATAPLPFPFRIVGTISDAARELERLLGPRLDPRVSAAALPALATSMRDGFNALR